MNTSKKTKYLGQQLISFMFIFMLILFLVIFLITRQLAYKVMRSNAEESISNLTETNAQMIDKNLSNIMTIAQELRTVINDDLYTPKQLKRHIHHLLIDNPRLISVCLAYDNFDIAHRIKGSVPVQARDHRKRRCNQLSADSHQRDYALAA